MPKPTIDARYLIGMGNTPGIIARVTSTMRKANLGTYKINEFRKEAGEAGSVSQLLTVVSRYVKIVE